ncbi:MAG: histidine kinase dimerization/phospho-acceptor domain-containing protein, partial [Terriglobales bacterium]
MFSIFNDSQPLIVAIEAAQQTSVETQPRALEQIENLLLFAVVSGTAISIALSCTLSYLFAKDLIARVRAASEASQSLVLGRPVNIEDQGKDEVSQLTQALQTASTQLSDYRRVELAILDESPDVLCTLDDNFRMAVCGKSTTALWGMEPEDIRGKSILAMCSEESVASTRNNLTLARTEPVVQFQNAMLAGNADIVNCDWRVKWSPDQKTFNCVVRNINEAIRVAEERKMFVSAVCHDIRSPLTALRLSLGILLGQMRGPVPEPLRLKLSEVDGLAQDLNRLVEDLLLSSKFDAGRFVLDISEIELSELCANELTEFRERYPSVEMQCRTSVVIKSDQTLIGRLFSLLLNAASRNYQAKSELRAKFVVDGNAEGWSVRLISLLPEYSSPLNQIADKGIDSDMLDPTVSLLRALIVKLGGSIRLESIDPE